MPMYFQKTENALKRAKEFIEVDKKESALECLNDVIHSKKHRQSWTTTHELIMKLFVELCVDLQRSAFAKDGLYQYRNICRDVSLHSFELVVKYFLKLASDRASAAREESEQAVLQEVEDLDVIMTPENLLLSTVSGEGAKERSDRVLLAPWVKFLWESYRNMLELLKNNNTIERVYADVAKDAFKFCLNYQRRTEFRKLCEILKNHLLQAQKYQFQSQHSLRFDNPDTIQFLVDVRFEQLECSINVDLWQEAFKAIEEIHNLLELSGKTPRPGLLDNYYSRQVKVYWMANNKLFHAAALHKLFVLWKEQKKSILPEDLQKIASRVLLATLCVPIEPTPSDVDRFLEVDQTGRDKARRLAALLRMNTLPTRASLLRDIGRYNILQHTPPELQQLYSCLEVEFNPLQLCKKASPILEGLEEDETLRQYVEPAKDVLLIRLIKEVSQVYETIELDWLAKLAPFTTPTQLETVVIETAQSNGIQVHVDHQTNCLKFGSDISFSYRNETPEGPYVQPMPSEALCGQLQMFSAALQQAVQIITAKETELEHAETRRELAQAYLEHSRADHRSVLNRKQIIEARKEFIESESRAKEHKENQEKLERAQQERKAEMERLQREAEERAALKRRKELADWKRIEREQRIESLKKTPVGTRALETITAEELDAMDVDDIVAKQLKQMEKEMREKETKLRTQEKKIDHWERAKRLVEIPLLEKQYQQQIDDDKTFHEQQEEERVTTEIKDRKEKEENQERLMRMDSSKSDFLKQVQQERHEAYLVKLKESEAMLEVARAERIEKRKQQRKARRKAEAAALKKAEEEKELRALQEAEKARLEEERRKRQEVLDAQLKKQRERDEEIEAKMRRKEEEARQAMEEKQERPRREEGDHRAFPERGSWRHEETEKPQENWRDREISEQKKRDVGGYPPARSGAYRPPGRIEGDGRDEREQEGDRGGWRRDGREDRWRGRDRDQDYGSPRTYRDPERRGWGRDREGEREGWRGRDRDQERGRDREGEREGWRGRDREGEREGWRGRDRDQERGRDREGEREGWRGRDREGEREGWRGREREGERDGGRDSWRGRDREGERDGGRDSWRGRDRDQDRGGMRQEGRDRDYGGPRRDRDPDRRGWGRDEGERDQERGWGRRDRDGPGKDGGGWRRGEGDPDRGVWRGRERGEGREDDRGGGGWNRGGRRDGGFGGGPWRRDRDDRDPAEFDRGRRSRDDWDTDRDRGGGGNWRDRDRDQGPPRQYDGEDRAPPRRDDDRAQQRDDQGSSGAWRGKRTSSPFSRGKVPPPTDQQQPSGQGEEGWEVVGRKR